jgi:hypothetical protein
MGSKMYHLLITSAGVIDVGERRIVRTARDYGSGKPRFIINLPTTRNDLWIYLWQRKVPVKVFIELPEDLTKYEKEYRSAEREE